MKGRDKKGRERRGRRGRQFVLKRTHTHTRARVPLEHARDVRLGDVHTAVGRHLDRIGVGGGRANDKLKPGRAHDLVKLGLQSLEGSRVAVAEDGQGNLCVEREKERELARSG